MVGPAWPSTFPVRCGFPRAVGQSAIEITLAHLGNISYRVGRKLAFDGKSERFVNDKEADKLLTREYRKGFDIKDEYQATPAAAAAEGTRS